MSTSITKDQFVDNWKQNKTNQQSEILAQADASRQQVQQYHREPENQASVETPSASLPLR